MPSLTQARKTASFPKGANSMHNPLPKVATLRQLGGRGVLGGVPGVFSHKTPNTTTREGSRNQAFVPSMDLRATRGAKNLQFLKCDVHDLRYTRTARKGEERKP